MQRIYHDLFHIAERILQIDPAYEIYWHGEKERFEVFWHGKLAFVVPFETLDVRTLVYAVGVHTRQCHMRINWKLRKAWLKTCLIMQLMESMSLRE